MSSNDLTTDTGYQSLLGKISEVYATGQARAAQAVNVHITETYWRIGRDIVEFEQGGNARADYGKGLLTAQPRFDPSPRQGFQPQQCGAHSPVLPRLPKRCEGFAPIELVAQCRVVEAG